MRSPKVIISQFAEWSTRYPGCPDSSACPPPSGLGPEGVDRDQVELAFVGEEVVATVTHLDVHARIAEEALQLEGADVLTIEGLAAADGPLHPMQEAFRENHGLQCGYCTPGMIMTAVDMVRRKGNDLDDRTIREQLEGNICRCTGYHNIVKAIAAGARAMRGGGATSKAAE